MPQTKPPISCTVASFRFAWRMAASSVRCRPSDRGIHFGREGPSVQIGAAIALVCRTMGAVVARTHPRARTVGAAGALAAAFNTPVAAVLFSLEEVIGDLNASLIGSTVVASVASVVVERSILGNEPLFHVPAYQLIHPGELLVYAALGVFGGVVSAIFCGGLLRLRGALKTWPAATRLWQPALGGLRSVLSCSCVLRRWASGTTTSIRHSTDRSRFACCSSCAP